MSMDKLFDGSDAHLLPGNAELIERLRRPFVMSMFANRGDLYEASECERHEAADALESAYKRIAEERETYDRMMEEGAEKLHEAERKLAVAREALLYANDRIGFSTLEAAEAWDNNVEKALAQIGGDDAGS